jgi:hypothetical protein
VGQNLKNTNESFMFLYSRLVDLGSDEILGAQTDCLAPVSSFIEECLQCFSDFQRFGTESASLDSMVNGAEGELVFYGPGTERKMFTKERCPQIRVISICLPFHIG